MAIGYPPFHKSSDMQTVENERGNFMDKIKNRQQQNTKSYSHRLSAFTHIKTIYTMSDRSKR